MQLKIILLTSTKWLNSALEARADKGTDKNGAKISIFESYFCGSAQLRPPFSTQIRKLEGEAEASRCLS